MNLMDEGLSCLLFSTADWDAPYWTNKQHMAMSMAKKGIRVLFVESMGLRRPTMSQRDIQRIVRRLKKGLSKPREVSKDIFVLSPLSVPFNHHWSVVRAFNQGLLKWQIGHFMKEHHFLNPLVWAYHPFVLEAIAGLEIGPVIYHCVDDVSQVPGIDAEKFQEEEKRLLAKCKAVFTTSDFLKKTLGNDPKIHYFSNVVDMEHFGRARSPGPLPEELSKIPEPRLGFIGALSDYKVDFSLLLDLAIKKPYWQWIFIGEEREGQTSSLVAKLRELPNCHFWGYRAYRDLPQYLRGMNVGLLPSLINDYTKAMFPMKYYEYLAAGLPVVSTSLEFTKSVNEGLLIGNDPEAFAEAIESQLKRGRLSEEEAVRFVGENTWEGRLEKMLEVIGFDL